MAGKKPVEKVEASAIVVAALLTGSVTVALIGQTPLIFNRMSEKVRRGLLDPDAPGVKRGTIAERAAAGPKHNPLAEYQGSPYRTATPDDASLLAIPAASVKRAMADVALDLPGTRKAQIGRLVWCPGEYLPVFGIPQLRMDVVRMADPSHTPDIRTRACIRQWATIVEVQFVEPLLKQTAIVNLLAAAGRIIGIGDGRQQKGALNFGQFDVVGLDDARLQGIIKTGGRAPQQRAMVDPAFYDDESRELYEEWARNHSTEIAAMSTNGVGA